jgi:hypothetical protein
MMRAAMVLPQLRSAVRNRRFAWLLALALWLPVAQWAAATHALLHLHDSVTANAADDPAVDLPGACDLCVVAAALGSGAPAPQAAPAFGAAPPAVRPAWHVAALPELAPALPYLTRAPPLSR